MGLFSYARSIYALDALDTRFTTSSTTPYKSVIDDRASHKKSKSPQHGTPLEVPIRRDSDGQPQAQPSKWNTPEFYSYYFVFITVIPYMFWVVYDVSRPSDPNYHKYENLLSPGWILGRKIDVSDSQYGTFRENIPYMALLLVFHPLLRLLYETLYPISTTNPRANSKSNGSAQSYVSTADGEARMNQRASFDFGFAIAFLGALHGFSALKVLVILYINFCIATRISKRYVPATSWIFNIGILFANELCSGYKFANMVESISDASVANILEKTELHNWGTWLDSHGGIMPRWEILFNITVLRLISFNLDHYWSLNGRAGSQLEVPNELPTLTILIITDAPKKKQLDPANLSERDRIVTPASAKDYTFRNYIAYTLYAPLYLVGPIITFNDYISQLKYPSATIETPRTIKYGIRFLLALLCMELVLHFDYCVAISKGNPNWARYTPAQLSLLSYFSLHIIWLKLLLPFRLFRLWALIDGIDPPENMLRCVSNSPSTVAFWRGWHRSFNRWLLRYIYIPLGGSSMKGNFGIAKSALNYITVFTFVALWHDIKLDLLIWGWLVVLFMMPEILAGYLFPRKRWLNHLTAYRCLCAVGTVGNLMMMMAANLVGFAVGVEGLKSIIYGIFQDYSGLMFLVTASCCLFVGIQVMFEIREAEMRKGIYLKC